MKNFGFTEWRIPPKDYHPCGPDGPKKGKVCIKNGIVYDRTKGGSGDRVDPILAGYYPKPNVVIEWITEQVKKKNIAKLLGFLYPYALYVIDTLGYDISTRVACYCTNVLLPLANVARRWRMTSGYTRGGYADPSNITQIDPEIIK